MRRLLAVGLGAVIAGAFVGPGTVTTAAAAGAAHGAALLWALAFSVLATLVLQLTVARLTALSGRELGEVLRQRYPAGVRGAAVVVLVVGAVVVGCAAYEAGNIVGGAAGASRLLPLAPQPLAAAIGVVAGVLLWIGTPRVVAHAFTALVAVMGVAFLATAVRIGPELPELLAGLVVPRLPPEAGTLALGLVGTTVVPYNLFLGSALARGRDLGELRFGLIVAVLAGGVISAGVLLTGTAVTGVFSFDALADVLTVRLGAWAAVLFGLGLFAAGFTSAVSAPLAAAVTARSLFAAAGDPRWDRTGRHYRAVWLAVLGTGVVFGMAGVRPIPVILLAQVLNGLLLPVAATALLLVANDRRLLGAEGVCRPAESVLISLVTLVTVLLGASAVLRGVAAAAGLFPPAPGVQVTFAAVTAALLALPVGRGVLAARRGRGTGRGRR